MWVHRRLVRGDLHRDDLCGGQRPGEETPGRTAISPRGHIHVDDLPELVDRPVDVAPPTGHLDVSLVDPPAVPDAMPAWACRPRQQRREALHPAEDADVVDLHSAFGQQLFNIAIRESVNGGTNAVRARSPPAGTGSQRTPISAGGPDEHSSCGACA